MARKRHLRCSNKTKPDTTNVAPVVKVPTKPSTKINKTPSPKFFKPVSKPNQNQSCTFLEKFDNRSHHSLVFSPLKHGASMNPWVLLNKKESGAVTRPTNVQVVFERMRANVKAANSQIEQFSNKVYAKRGWGHWAEMLVGIYEKYLNRRTALLKELEIIRVKKLLKLEA